MYSRRTSLLRLAEEQETVRFVPIVDRRNGHQRQTGTGRTTPPGAAAMPPPHKSEPFPFRHKHLPYGTRFAAGSQQASQVV